MEISETRDGRQRHAHSGGLNQIRSSVSGVAPCQRHRKVCARKWTGFKTTLHNGCESVLTYGPTTQVLTSGESRRCVWLSEALVQLEGEDNVALERAALANRIDLLVCPGLDVHLGHVYVEQARDVFPHELLNLPASVLHLRTRPSRPNIASGEWVVRRQQRRRALGELAVRRCVRVGWRLH